MKKCMKIYEHDHFHLEYEDYKNNLYILVLNDEIEKWIEENLIGSYDVDVEDYYNRLSDTVVIEFTHAEDALAFKLRWI